MSDQPPATGPLPDETRSLIAATKVNGTAVYDSAATRIGTIEELMLDKRTGHVAYAVMSFGGFLGFGERHHPLPWAVLRYDVALGGYVVPLDRDRLEGSPAYAPGAAPDWAGFGGQVDDYYRA